MDRVSIRRAAKEDVAAVADLVVRLKRLNNEFDPLFNVVNDARERAERYVSDSLGAKSALLIVATQGEKVIAFLRGEIRERLFYDPHMEGHITDMYVLPEFRRKQLGHDILQQGSDALIKMGAEIIVCELPTRNDIGFQFYSKRGFRRFAETFAHVPG